MKFHSLYLNRESHPTQTPIPVVNPATTELFETNSRKRFPSRTAKVIQTCKK